ncbi:MAG TPA: polyprenol monophosphomannose synthase [Chitinophagaceae bacterium]|nr:polyprenol monophosphomannose synthase [Chitinophagaceae bacterium]
MEKLVVIPTYNEKDNIESIIRYVFNLNKGYHILVVDDSSPDGTGEIVRKMQQEFSGLHLEVRKGKLGLGTAYIHGFKWGLQKGYQFIFEMDADYSHNPDDLDRLYEACKNGGADVAVGSRYVKDGKVENWPWDRNMLSKGGALYTRLITWMPVKDPTAGFMCYKKEVLAAINLDEVTFVGYAFQIEMKFAAWKLGFIIKEVPITFIDRKLGVSKMNKGIVKEGILGVIAIQWQSMFKNYRRRLSNPTPRPVASNQS